MSSDEFLENKPVEKKVEMQNIVLTGYSRGLLSWLIKGKYVWTSYDLDHPIVEHVYDGTLYDAGKVVLKNFSARRVNVTVQQESLFADQGMRAALVRMVDGKEQIVDVWAEQLQYFSQEKKSFVRQKVIIKDESNNLEIEAQNAQIDHSHNTVSFGNDFVLKTKDSEVLGDALICSIDEQRCEVNGNARIHKQAEQTKDNDAFRREDTDVRGNRLLVISSSGNSQVIVEGAVTIRQIDKQGYADQAVYADATHTVILTGNAGVVFDRSDWLLDKETIRKIKNKEAQSAVREKLIMKANALVIDTKTKDLIADTGVWVQLKNKEAKSRHAVYDSKAEVITLTGDVSLKKSDGSWVDAQTVVVNAKNEEFKADGQVESKVILKR
jgi:lipopolysaccharide export system protein LptA